MRSVNASAYQVDPDDTMVSVRLPRHVVDVVNGHIRVAGGVILEDNREDAASDMTLGFSPALLASEMKRRRNEWLYWLSLSAILVASVVIATMKDHDGLAGVSLGLLGTHLGYAFCAWRKWRIQRRLARGAKAAGLK